MADEIIDILRQKRIELDFPFLFEVMSITNKMDDKIVILNSTLEKKDLDESAITALLNTLSGKGNTGKHRDRYLFHE